MAIYGAVKGKIPKFRAVTSGLMTFDEPFGGGFGLWQETHSHLFKPLIFNSPDFLHGKDDKITWLWSVNDEMTTK